VCFYQTTDINFHWIPSPDLSYSDSLQKYDFSNWDLTFPLLLGNERTGDLGKGYISQVYIADRGISKEEVAQVFTDKGSLTIISSAAYQLTGQVSYPDQTKHLPDLSSRDSHQNSRRYRCFF